MEKTQKITARESYEVMLDFLIEWYTKTGNANITDILSGALYFKDGEPIDPAFLEYWEASIKRVKNQTNNPYNRLKDV